MPKSAKNSEIEQKGTRKKTTEGKFIFFVLVKEGLIYPWLLVWMPHYFELHETNLVEQSNCQINGY